MYNQPCASERTIVYCGGVSDRFSMATVCKMWVSPSMSPHFSRHFPWICAELHVAGWAAALHQLQLTPTFQGADLPGNLIRIGIRNIPARLGKIGQTFWTSDPVTHRHTETTWTWTYLKYPTGAQEPVVLNNEPRSWARSETSEGRDAAVKKSTAQSGSGCGQDSCVQTCERTDANRQCERALHSVTENPPNLTSPVQPSIAFISLYHINLCGTGYRNGPQIKVEETTLVLVPTYGDTVKVGHQETPRREQRWYCLFCWRPLAK